MYKASVDDVVNSQLSEFIGQLEQKFSAEFMFIKSGMVNGLDDTVKHCIEMVVDSKTNENPLKSKLCVMLETNGGYIQVVERIVRVFRNHFHEVVFVIPNCAYSAGTVLALSGDELYMDYYSVLGPIDPQINGIPATGYLQKFNELMNVINRDVDGNKTRAEAMLLIKKFDPEKLFFIEQSKIYAINLLKDWLPKYKFKSWTKTETGNKRVTDKMKTSRAAKIAEILGNPKRWHSHGRGIGIKELTNDEIKLKVIDFGIDNNLNPTIRLYYDILTDYLRKHGIDSALHGSFGLRRL